MLQKNNNIITEATKMLDKLVSEIGHFSSRVKLTGAPGSREQDSDVFNAPSLEMCSKGRLSSTPRPSLAADAIPPPDSDALLSQRNIIMRRWVYPLDDGCIIEKDDSTSCSSREQQNRVTTHCQL